MSRRWLCLALLLLSACYRKNPENCVATPGICASAELCDTVSERCIDPSKTLAISSIDKTFIKADGGDVAVITGIFMPSGTSKVRPFWKEKKKGHVRQLEKPLISYRYCSKNL